MAGSEAAQLLEAVASSERELGEAQAAVGAAQEKKKAMVAAAKVGAGGWGPGTACCACSGQGCCQGRSCGETGMPAQPDVWIWQARHAGSRPR